MSRSAVTAVKWLPNTAMRGCVVDKQRHIPNEAGSEADMDEDVDPKRAPTIGDTDAIEKEFDMNNYDEEETPGLNYFTHIDADLRLNAKRDPHQNYDEPSDSEDEEFYAIKETDLIFAAANAEEDRSFVDIYVYDTVEYSMFTRQTFDLNSYPLSLEFLPSFSNNDKSTLLAVGSFDQVIDLWDIADLQADEPKASLGVAMDLKAPPKMTKAETHTDAVLALHTCPTSRHVLASGSADHTVRVWDLNTQQSIKTLSHHSDKVQAVQWHPDQAAVLLTAGYDREVCVLDARQATPTIRKAAVGAADPEAVHWVTSDPFKFVVTTEAGDVLCFDLRKMSTEKICKKPVWSVNAHKGACSSVAFGLDGRFVTTGVDGMAKVWSLGDQPTLLGEKAMAAGPVFSVSAIGDDLNFFAFAGNEAGIWNLQGEDF